MLNLTVPPWNADFCQIIQCLYNSIEVSSTLLLFLRRFSCFRSRYVPSFLKLLIKIEKICGQLKRKRTQDKSSGEYVYLLLQSCAAGFQYGGKTVLKCSFRNIYGNYS